MTRPTKRIVVFGATGYTGRLVAQALVKRGIEPVLAARSKPKLRELAAELGGGLPIAVADVEVPGTVRGLIERGDVLISTVGPFLRYGQPAVEAAVAAGATYFDSTGEGSFVRRLFDEYDRPARAAGIAMLPAFGYDYVPGNLAAGLALRDAGPDAVRVDVGYFGSGPSGAGVAASSGTQASSVLIATEPAYRFTAGKLKAEAMGRRFRTFTVGGKARRASSIGGTEQLSLPRAYPALQEVDVYLGWFGKQARQLQVASFVLPAVTALPPVKWGQHVLSGRMQKGGGPSQETLESTGSVAVAVAYDGEGDELATVRVEGPNPYLLTGDLLAWGAAAAGTIGATGVVGPIEAYGLEALEAGCAELGLRRVE